MAKASSTSPRKAQPTAKPAEHQRSIGQIAAEAEPARTDPEVGSSAAAATPEVPNSPDTGRTAAEVAPQADVMSVEQPAIAPESSPVDEPARSPEPASPARPFSRLHLHYGRFERDMNDAPGIDEQGLFIVGCARSGTTAFHECLNVAPEIYLLVEANLSLNFWRDDFMDWFNQMQGSFEQPRSKGTIALDAGNPANWTGQFLIAQSKRFRYIGEKVAFGPHGLYYDTTHQESFFWFHLRFFYRSKYFFIFRRPDEVITSMHTMFPTKSVQELACVWLLTVDLFLDCLNVYPHVLTVILDKFGRTTLTSIGEILGVNLNQANIIVDRVGGRVTTPDVARRTWHDAESLDLIGQCQRVYELLASSFDEQSLTLLPVYRRSAWSEDVRAILRDAQRLL